MISISEALTAIFPIGSGKGWCLRGTPTNETEFNSMFCRLTGVDETNHAIEEKDPSKFETTWAEVVAKQAELQTEYDNNAYQRSRRNEYPTWETQLDYIYHNGVDKWKTDIVDPIKTKYPKPS